jgi:CorA-like Mg2+ transporter protein
LVQLERNPWWTLSAAIRGQPTRGAADDAAVPNFVASIYGMNFNHLIPASEWQYGFILVTVFLGCMVAWGFIHSRLLGWL